MHPIGQLYRLAGGGSLVLEAARHTRRMKKSRAGRAAVEEKFEDLLILALSTEDALAWG